MSAEMDVSLIAGIVLGLSSGFSPGPLSTLVISQSLQYGAREGIKVALAPFVTDLPIIVVSVFALSKISDFQTGLGMISLAGGVFLLYLAYSSFRTTKIDVEIDTSSPQSLGKGTIVNFFSPSPYLFWLTVGAPNVIAAWTQSPLIAVAFLASFYTCLIGGKICLALIAAKSRALLSGNAYGYVMRFLGASLLVFAFLLFRDGINFLTG